MGGGAGRGGRRRGSPLGCGRLCGHTATISSSTVPQIQFIDSGWLFLLCGQRRVLTVQTVQLIVKVVDISVVAQMQIPMGPLSEKHRDSPVAVH